MGIKSKFLPHLSDPLRRKIATDFAQHELRKLLPHIRDAKTWEAIDADVADWYERLTVQNFWNGIHGISIGFRLKSIVPLITSLNIKWSEKDVPITDLYFGGKFGPIKELASTESARDVQIKLFQSEHASILDATSSKMKETDEESSARGDYALFVVRKEGKLIVIDGNRRLLRAILNAQTSIKAFVGEPSSTPEIFEHWVPTSLLIDLNYWYKRQYELKRDTTEATAKVIAELIRDSSAGRIEFVERVVRTENEPGKSLFNGVKGILATYNVDLPSKASV